TFLLTHTGKAREKRAFFIIPILLQNVVSLITRLPNEQVLKFRMVNAIIYSIHICFSQIWHLE
ncbi:MAG: hypothetical protein K8R31_12120, partial [Bacteroidales bacterium]|nr:hypothetical protein [Bacteroidales bacterium]